MTDVNQKLKQIDQDHASGLESCARMHDQYVQALDDVQATYMQQLVAVGHHYLTENNLIPEDKDDLKQLVTMFTGVKGDYAELVAERDAEAQKEQASAEQAKKERNVITNRRIIKMGSPAVIGSIAVISTLLPSILNPVVFFGGFIITGVKMRSLLKDQAKGNQQAILTDKETLEHRVKRADLDRDVALYPLAETITRAFVQNDPTLVGPDNLDETNTHALSAPALMKGMLKKVAYPAVS